MALNDNYNIGNLPTLDLPRSKFTKNHQHITTFNVGDLVPIFVDELLPGTTVTLRTNKLVRLQTLLNPIFSNIYMDTYFFFVPYRLVWSHWQNFMGENTSGHWYPSVSYQIPLVNSGSGFAAKSSADHFGLPTSVASLDVNALPLRAYALIWNEYFRDENLSDPVNIYMGDNTQTASSTDNYINDAYKGIGLLPVAKYRDVFTTALPAPQKGPMVTLGNQIIGNAGVLTMDISNSSDVHNSLITTDPLKWSLGHNTEGKLAPVYSDVNKSAYINPTGSVSITDSYKTVYPTNLYAVGKNYYSGIPEVNDIYNGPLRMSVPINELRLAFATQKLLERDARYGTRYTEILQGHFGITSPDARLQRPEFLGGNHFALNIDQVVETSGTTDSYVLGETGAYSVTADSSDDIVGYSALEHGVIIGLACCRYEHSYQQGLDKMWSRTDRLSFYWPELSNLGEIGIKNKEIVATADATDNDSIFGYQEIWYDYRTKRNYVTGEMRSNYTTSLDSWHLADDYSEIPTLEHSWILEDGNTVNRVLAVSNNVADQVFADFYFEYDYVAPIPVYSIPGLIDMR